MFQLPTWPAGNRQVTSVAALEAAVNAALGAGGGAESVLVVPSAADATAEVNARLEAMAVAGGGILRVRRGRIGDPVRLDARVQLRGDDCTLIFDSPIVIGATGRRTWSGPRSTWVYCSGSGRASPVSPTITKPAA